MNGLKERSHMIISADEEKKAFDKILHDRSPKRLTIEKTYYNIIKATYNKPIANITLNGEKEIQSISINIRNKDIHSTIPIQYSASSLGWSS